MKQYVMNRVLSERAKRVRSEQAAVEKRMADAFAIPEIDKAHKAYSALSFERLENSGDAHLKDKEKRARAAYLSALKKYGFSEKEFRRSPSCPVCRDTGVAKGKVCRCVWQEYIEALKVECDIVKRAPFTFEDCDLSVAEDETQREQLDLVYRKMHAFADKYPLVNRVNIVLSGKPGTGKSCLAHAMARRLVERGYYVKAVSAFEFNQAMVDAHTSPISERKYLMEAYLDADMLLIDDFGSEPIFRNVTAEYLLIIIEERSARGKLTVLTTNCSPDDVLNRYQGRIYSRLTDKHKSLFITLTGKDLRR